MRAPLILTLMLALAGPAFAAGGGEAKPKAAPHERKLTTSPAWVSVDPVTVAIMRQNRVQGIFLVEFGLDIEDEALRHKAIETLPRLRDAWLRTLADFVATRIRVGRQADLAALTARLQQTADTMLGAPGSKVLLQQAVVRQN